jgi:hypothetical protein
MEILLIEFEIKNIFAKETITDADVHLANYLINKWKRLTNWVSDTTPVLKHTIC